MPSKCYRWLRNVNPRTRNGATIMYVYCAGCRSLKDRGQVNRPLKTELYDDTNSAWLTIVRNHIHFPGCIPLDLKMLREMHVRRSIQAQINAGFDIAPGAARVHAEMCILRENADKTDQVRAEICFHAIGADLASRHCFSRARKKKFSNLRTYAEYLSDDLWALRLTERGSRANREDWYFGEPELSIASGSVPTQPGRHGERRL
uniref:Uncharacterized protein n=1 Tax=Ditylenchus dipsaci TaxID=166011 RepID=A0A915D0S6_9BILA